MRAFNSHFRCVHAKTSWFYAPIVSSHAEELHWRWQSRSVGTTVLAVHDSGGGDSERLNHPSNAAATVTKVSEDFSITYWVKSELTDRLRAQSWPWSRLANQTSRFVRVGGTEGEGVKRLVRHNKLIKDVTANSGPPVRFFRLFKLGTVRCYCRGG